MEVCRMAKVYTAVAIVLVYTDSHDTMVTAVPQPTNLQTSVLFSCMTVKLGTLWDSKLELRRSPEDLFYVKRATILDPIFWCSLPVSS
jgi:hypothetical protein